MRELDALTIPLAGTNLVEASAGTGKTHTITTLYTRLILEHGLKAEEILVVTFTVPATQELKHRIRSRLKEMLKALEGGACPDEHLAAQIARLSQPEIARGRLRLALRTFDTAAIATIHGFCQRMLKEFAFETGSRFSTELVSDQRELLLDFVDDFFRRRLYGLAPEILSIIMDQGLSPEELVQRIEKAGPLTRILPQIDRPVFTGLEAYRLAVQDARKLWAASRSEIEQILMHDPGLNRTSYKDALVRRAMAAMDAFLASGAHPPMPEPLEKLTTAKIASCIKKGFSAPRHACFDACSRVWDLGLDLEDQARRYSLWLTTEAVSHARAEFPSYKDAQGVLHFDDLLLRMHAALASPGGARLRESIRQRFKAVLIDEFQDTDPIQYDIFKGLFTPGMLFLIGDPKQAIYSFRGADIFTYLKAAADVPGGHRFTLTSNWRSVPGLITAVNTVFDFPRAFVFPEIGFDPATPAKPTTPRVPGPALKLWFLPSGGSKPVAKADAVEMVANGVAVEITRILAQGTFQPHEIAVLVRRKSQARLMRDMLTVCHVPCVIASDENVFESLEAFHLEIFLKAVVQPGREGYICAALATPLFGLTALEIETVLTDEQRWEACEEQFQRFHRLWRENGFMRMMRAFIAGDVKVRLVGLPRGERRLTNLIHLAELLHQHDRVYQPSMEGLLGWFALQRLSPERIEEHEIRLESDADAVKILTTHKSKGLEFPVVFCPYAWDSINEDDVVFHDRDAKILDLGSPDIDSHRLIGGREALAENMRLLYVALTRGREQSYLAWGHIHTAENSALEYAFSPERFACPPFQTDDEMRRALGVLAHGDIELEGLPMGQPLPYRLYAQELKLAARQFKGAIDSSFRITSYTSLTRGVMEERDYDLLEPRHAEQPSDRSIFALPKGARTGLMLHALLERADFTAPDQRDLIGAVLAEAGFEPHWQDAVAGMLATLCDAPLDGPGSPRLRQVGVGERLNEFEFYFPFAARSEEVFMEVCRTISPAAPDQWPTRMENLVFEPMRGFMRGFMDLVFHSRGRYYLVDWKSNYLGSAVEDYGPAALAEEMERELYPLQYHLYTLALHRYLKHRLSGYDYDRHFGGVFYVFLRGVDASGGYGIHRARPSFATIQELEKALIGEGS